MERLFLRGSISLIRQIRSMARSFQPMATNGIHGIGGIDDEATVIQNIHYLLQVLWIIVSFS